MITEISNESCREVFREGFKGDVLSGCTCVVICLFTWIGKAGDRKHCLKADDDDIEAIT